MARDGLNIGGFVSDLAHAATKQVERSVKELRDGLGEDMDRVIDKTKNEGLLQGAWEMGDLFSPGNLVTETADAFNIIPEDPGLKELVSAGVNLVASPFGAFRAAKDVMEAVDACTNPSAGAIAQRPTQAQTPRSPEDAKRAAIVAAMEAAMARVEEKLTRADGHGGFKHILPAHGGYCGGGSVSDGYRNTIADLMKRLRELYGEDKTSKADAEIDKLLKNKNLCFEDMIFLLMRKVIKQGQSEVKELAGELRGVGDKNRADRKEMNGEIAELHRKYAATKDPGAREQIGNQIRELEDKRELTVEERMESRAEKAEELKNALQKLSEMQQALSNVLNTQHETAMGAIRNIR